MQRTWPLILLLATLSSAATGPELIFDTTFTSARVFAYDLPEPDGRAEAMAYVKAMRDRFKPGAEIVDVSGNPAGLKEKLRAGFILYTTLGEKSRLLRLATARLGWRLENGEFQWRDVSAQAAGIRFLLVGRNPYSKGFCAIYATGSNRALAGINGLFHGQASYHVFQGSQLLREGFYDGKFVSRETISRAAALADVNQFFSTLRRVHPQLLAKVSEAEYRDLRRQTIAGVAGKADSNGQVPVEEMASLLYYAAARFQDGHTAVWWQTPLNDWNTRGRRFPSFRLRFVNGLFLVAAARDRSIVGAEVLAVNGVPVRDFLRPVLDRCSGETLAFRAARFIDQQPFWYYLTNLFGAGATCTLTLRDARGDSREAAVETLNYAEYRAFDEQDRAATFQPNRQGTAVEFFDSGATAHFLYPAFQLSPEEKKKVDRVFEEIKTRKVRNLVLDVRGNGGGQSVMADYIFRYLYDGKFRSLSKIRFKGSWDILPQLPRWSVPIAFFCRGRSITISVGEHTAPKPGAFFSGRVYLLTDNGSYSMATDFAAMFRDYQAGTIVGYETGGLPNTFGGPHPFTLKHSRIPCAVAWTQLFAPRPKPGDDQHGVLPDVPLTGAMLAGFQDEKDPVLAFTLHYIQTRSEPAGLR